MLKVKDWESRRDFIKFYKICVKIIYILEIQKQN